MNKLIAILFAFSCFATSALSGSIMGAGMWFWAIIATGIFVVVSQYVPKLSELGTALALVLSVISIGAVLLGLLAATIGGSFKLDGPEALLLFFFFLNAVLGFTLSIVHKKSKNSFSA